MFQILIEEKFLQQEKLFSIQTINGSNRQNGKKKSRSKLFSIQCPFLNTSAVSAVIVVCIRVVDTPLRCGGSFWKLTFTKTISQTKFKCELLKISPTNTKNKRLILIRQDVIDFWGKQKINRTYKFFVILSLLRDYPE